MMDSQTPYWLNLISHFSIKGYIWNGLTIPFIVGARSILEPSEKLMTVSELIQSLDKYGCTILRCGKLREIVVGDLDKETLMQKQSYHIISNRIVNTDFALSKVNSLDNLIELIEKEDYNLKIEKQLYSKENGGWEKYSDIDETRIKEILLNK